MLFIKNGKVFTMEDGTLDRASILIENGKIKEVGVDLVAPLDAEVIDAEGSLVFPGFIDAHTHLGMWEEGLGFEGDDGNEVTNPVTSELRSIDAINPLETAFPKARKGGVTCVASGPGSANVIGGTFSVIKTYGDRIDDMIMIDPVAMKCAFGENPKRVYSGQKKAPSTRMATAAIMRQTLGKAKEYESKVAIAERENDPSKRPAFDLQMEQLIPVIRREIYLKAHAHRADDILTAIRIAKEFDVRLSLEHCTEGHLIAHHLGKEGYPAVVGPSYGFKTKVELQNLSFETPKVLMDHGVKVAIMTDHPVIPLESLPMCAAFAFKAGLAEMDALKAITINPAEILGIDDKVGSIKVGKDADIVIWDRHPFDIQSNTLYTIIDGKIVYKK